MSQAFLGTLVAAALLTGCGDGGSGGGDGDGCSSPLVGTADELSLDLSTSERSASKYYMVGGEVGRVSAYVQAGGYILGSAHTTLRSSDPSVVQLGHDGSTETLNAMGAGSATITAEGCGLSREVPIQVSDAPLPIDALVVNALPTSDSPGTETNDPNGNLLSLALAVGDSTPLQVFAMRNGEWVFGWLLQPVLASSDPAVAEIMNVSSDAGVVARSVGNTEMSVTVRNLTWRFEVQVTTP